MAKRQPIVSQHLERISRKALEKHRRIIEQHIRGRHGIYALYRRDKLYYVGLASNLRSRLNHHLKNAHAGKWDRFSVYLTIDTGHTKELESLVLRIVQPDGNKQSGKFYRSENLMRKFRGAMKAEHKAELDDIMGTGQRKAKATDKRKRPRKKAVAQKAGRQPTLAQYVTEPFPIRSRFKGKLIRAKVRRDGSVRFAGKVYTSPSQAAAVACGRRACNGWTFWSYERAPADWVTLDHLRK